MDRSSKETLQVGQALAADIEGVKQIIGEAAANSMSAGQASACIQLATTPGALDMYPGASGLEKLNNAMTLYTQVQTLHGTATLDRVQQRSMDPLICVCGEELNTFGYNMMAKTNSLDTWTQSNPASLIGAVTPVLLTSAVPAKVFAPADFNVVGFQITADNIDMDGGPGKITIDDTEAGLQYQVKAVDGKIRCVYFMHKPEPYIAVDATGTSVQTSTTNYEWTELVDDVTITADAMTAEVRPLASSLVLSSLIERFIAVPSYSFEDLGLDIYQASLTGKC